MNCARRLAFTFTWVFLFAAAKAQNPLPDINVRELAKGKVQVSWINPYETCVQLAVQRSADSINNFRTIFSSLSPELPANGYVDNKPLKGVKTYYRIFYVLLGGAYYFSKSVPIEVRWTNPAVEPVAAGKLRTEKNVHFELTNIMVRGAEVFRLNNDEYARFKDSIFRQTKDNLKRINTTTVEWTPAPLKKDEKLVSIFQRESLLARMTEADYRKFKDSIASKTKDTLYMIDPFRIQLRPFTTAPAFISVYRNDSLLLNLEPSVYRRFRDSIAASTRDTLFSISSSRIDIHPYTPKYAWRPSVYVYTNTQGYVTILLPLVKQHRYRVVFFDENNVELFQIRNVRETELLLDKTNFIHAGWFGFELFEDDRLKEKNKFYLARD